MKIKLKLNDLLLYLFISVPIISATVSAIHLEKFIALGNPRWLSIPIATAYELANITILLLMIRTKGMSKTSLYTTFILLVLMQILGNIYYSYNYVYEMWSDAKWIETWMEMISIFSSNPSAELWVFVLGTIIGAPVPIIALFLTKVVADWKSEVEKGNKVTNTTQTKNVVKKIMEQDEFKKDISKLLLKQVTPEVEKNKVKRVTRKKNN